MPQNAVSTNLPKAADAALTTRVRLRYVEQGDAWGSPVVLLHGFSDSSFSFMPLLPHLPASVRAIALDQRGHGESDRPRDGYAPQDFARDALALMDSLGIERATFVGHSMGTFVAREAALAAPERVASLILIAPGATGRGPAMRELWQAVETMVDPMDVQFVRQFQASTIHRPVAPEFFNKVVEESLKVPARVWRAALSQLAAIDSAERCRGIFVPDAHSVGRPGFHVPSCGTGRADACAPRRHIGSGARRRSRGSLGSAGIRRAAASHDRACLITCRATSATID